MQSQIESILHSSRHFDLVCLHQLNYDAKFVSSKQRYVEDQLQENCNLKEKCEIFISTCTCYKQ